MQAPWARFFSFERPALHCITLSMAASSQAGQSNLCEGVRGGGWPPVHASHSSFLPLFSPRIERSNVATPLWRSVGVNPNTPKVGDLESFGTPKCLGFDSKAQNTSH